MEVFISISHSSICEIPIVLRGKFRCFDDYWHASLSPLRGLDKYMPIAPFLYPSNLESFHRVVAGKCFIFTNHQSFKSGIFNQLKALAFPADKAKRIPFFRSNLRYFCLFPYSCGRLPSTCPGVQLRSCSRLPRANVNTTLLDQLERPIFGKAEVFSWQCTRKVYLSHSWLLALAIQTLEFANNLCYSRNHCQCVKDMLASSQR